MTEFAVRAEQVSKLYQIGERESYKALRDTLTDMAWAPVRGARAVLRRRQGGSPERPATDLWALRDVSFEVGQGDAVGIIGRNGAGKSTLLKVLARITTPTTGRVTLHGRLASLLEVGTGFHAELTGRENIFLNGAILGMKRAEINRHFDEIVAFAEIDQFIDTPVKRYSSGMYVRLAFAVAAHLDSEILVMDEVLAVGDATFQKKCLGKMSDVARQGRTVLFVSHNLAAVQALCNIGLLLDQGRVGAAGAMSSVIYHYQERLQHVGDLQTIRGVQIVTIAISGAAEASGFTAASPLTARLEMYTTIPLLNCQLNLVIEDAEGRYLIHSRTDQLGQHPAFAPGLHQIQVDIARLSLRAGIYALWVRLYTASGPAVQMADSERVLLEVSGAQVDGLISVPCSWSWTPVAAPVVRADPE